MSGNSDGGDSEQLMVSSMNVAIAYLCNDFVVVCRLREVQPDTPGSRLVFLGTLWSTRW